MKLLPNIHLKSDGFIHATHPQADDFTLCAKAMYDDGEVSNHTMDRITCPSCIKFISYIKNFKSSDLNKSKVKK